MTVGMYLLSHLGVGTSTSVMFLSMFVLGVGIGGVMQVLVIAVQNAVGYEDLGVATSGATFFRSIGGSFGTAAFGTVFANSLSGNLAHYFAGVPLPAGFSGTAGASPPTLAKLPAPVHTGYIEAYAASLETVFLVATPIAAVAFVLTWFLKEIPCVPQQECLTRVTPLLRRPDRRPGPPSKRSNEPSARWRAETTAYDSMSD